MDINYIKNENLIIYDAVGGSIAYGLSTPQSDEDIRGIFVIPNKEYLKLTEPVQQVSDSKSDITYYSLRRFFQLVSTANPNMIEMLWYPDDCIKTCSPIMQKLMANRHLFISKKAYYTHSSYAFSQIKKAKGQNKMINHPELGIKPVKEKYCWIIPMNRPNRNLGGLEVGAFRPVPIQEMKDFKINEFHCSSLEHAPNVYRLYYYGQDAKGVFRGDDMLTPESIPLQDEHEKFYGLLIYNHQEFEKALIEHNKYNTWIEERNINRWIDQEKGLIAYDAKNMMHCVRLLLSGENILRNGEPIVRFDGEMKKYLMAIRQGEFEYDKLMNEVEEKMEYLKDLNEKSSIPHGINKKQVERLYEELIGFSIDQEEKIIEI